MVLPATWEAHERRAVATLDGSAGCRSAWASERPIVLLTPGNAGRGKRPHFWMRLRKPRTRRLA